MSIFGQQPFVSIEQKKSCTCMISELKTISNLNILPSVFTNKAAVLPCIRCTKISITTPKRVTN